MNHRLKIWREKIHRRYFVWGALVLLSGVLAFYWDATRGPEKTQDPKQPESEQVAATYIPAGFVLVPIEVANYESLDSILGKFGVVDLYLPATEPRGRPQKLAERVRILRAPLNPQHFAVLVAERDSARLVTQTGPFIVVVQNPKSTGTGFVNGTIDVEDPHRPRQASSKKKTDSTHQIIVEVQDAL